MVAKLFAKHIKLKDAITYVKRTRWALMLFYASSHVFVADIRRMNFGVGTPSRIIDLLDSGAFLVHFHAVGDDSDQVRCSVSHKA